MDVKTFKNNNKNKNNKLKPFNKDGKLLEKYKTKQKDVKNIELNALQVYDDRYIKTKTGTFDAKVYNFHRLKLQKMV